MKVTDLILKLNSLFEDSFKKDALSAAATKAAELVKTRTRKGFGVANEGGPQKRLKPLSPKYIEKRKKLAARGQLSPETSPARSNLTKTGDMLNDIKTSVGTNEARVYIDSAKNVTKAENVQKDRPFMNLSASEKKEIVKIINEKIKMDIKKSGL